MKQVITTEGVPIKLWLDDIEEGALEQAKNLANLPFCFKHIAIMPDAHQGYGMPIGGVLATKDVIILNAVGVDIGCGVCAVKSSIKDIDEENIKKIMGGSSTYKGGIRSKIPVGFNHHSKKRDEKWMPKIRDNSLIISLQYDNALKQIGTLGGGNHFIEIQKGSDGYIWFMVHSGSRNIGNKVAKYYNDIAKNLNEKWFSIVPKKLELAFLPINSEEGYSYIEEMNYCVNFALNSRALMIEYIKESILEIFSDTTFSDIMDIAHNYAAMENHFGQNVMVHRKGATRVREEEIGIIPGSQGTSSFIVKGLGNKESFMSCSHGAGRKMSRTRARNELNLEEEIKTLDNLGIIHSVRNQKDLDESSNAYKDIHTVMKNQEDLVEIIEELKPLAVIKG